jgi:hypothetical protein
VGSRGNRDRAPCPRTATFAGNIGAEPETHVLLAMQKVEGSNPFSRFVKDLHLQVFLVSAVALFVCGRSD